MAICELPPEGWACTRAAPHSGPCAAIPRLPASVVAELAILLNEVISLREQVSALQGANNREVERRREAERRAGYGTWDGQGHG